MKHRVWMMAAILTVGLADGAQAWRWRIDGNGGIFIPTGDIDVGRRDVDTDVGGSFGAGGGFGLGDLVDVTAHFQTNISDLDEDFDLLEVYSFTVGSRVYLMPPGRFRPWVIGEIGWYHARADGLFEDEIDDDSFGMNVGAGFDIFVHRIVSLGADIRYHNAFDAFDGMDFVTTMFNVGIHLGQ
jgi:hypothetical protein